MHIKVTAILLYPTADNTYSPAK